jgi:hypothetical protein
MAFGTIISNGIVSSYTALNGKNLNIPPKVSKPSTKFTDKNSRISVVNVGCSLATTAIPKCWNLSLSSVKCTFRRTP